MIYTHAGRSYGHVPGHDYLDVEVVADDRSARSVQCGAVDDLESDEVAS